MVLFALGILLGQEVDHRRVHQPGQDRVAADALLRVLRGDRHGERVHRPLAGIVGQIGNPLGAADRGDRAHVHDRALALLLHDRQHVLGRQEEALHVDVEHAMPLVLAQLDRPALGADADIVVEDVDPAPLRHAGIDHGLHVGIVRGVGLVGDREAGTDFLLDQPHGLLGGRPLQVDAKHPGALAREGDRRALAVAPARPTRARPDDDRHPVLQLA